MRTPRVIAAATALLLAVAVAACGIGEGASQEGSATLTVTRDHGAERLLEAMLEDPPASQTVVRFLDSEAEIETSFSGNFVDSIEGVEGRIEAGRSLDWFFYVNGYWSPVGAGEAEVRAGDRIWWDYRDWTDAYRVSAVVGSFPEPFLHGLDGTPYPTEVVCFSSGPACERVAGRLADHGVEAEVVAAGDGGGDPATTLRVLVGEWERVRSDPAAAQLERGVGASGVFAEPVRCRGGWALELRDERDRPAATIDAAGWVAAVRRGEEQPSWIVSGSSPERVTAAADTLTPESLGDRYAVAVAEGSKPLALPASDAGTLPAGPTGGDC